jgi:hypothetical protein
MLRGLHLYLVSEVLEHLIGTAFKSQPVRETSVTSCNSTPGNIPQERISHLQRAET